MRFLRFLLKELVLHGIVFAIVGTIVLSALYLLSIGACRWLFRCIEGFPFDACWT